MQFLQDYFRNFTSGIGITDVIDILLVAILVYAVIQFIQKTRAQQLVKGLLIIILLMIVSGVLHLYTLNWILKETMTLGILAFVIIFQPELRRGLEFVGRKKWFTPIADIGKEEAKALVSEVVNAIDYFSKNKVGALIIIEKETQLDEIVETGTVVDAKISDQVLGNIFYEGAPLHDGAVIIRGTRVYAAGCVLPLTQNKSLSKDLGTRHRAGIGITENSDALVIIVSEETGIISMAEDGKLTRFLEPKAVEKKLLGLYMNPARGGFEPIKKIKSLKKNKKGGETDAGK